MNKSAGFTIIEVIVTMVILSLGILGIARLMPLGARVSQHARLLTRASEYAQQKLEEIKTFKSNDARLSAGIHTEPGLLDTVFQFQRWYTVTDDVPMTDMKLVVVTVAYKTTIRQDTLRMRTYIAKN